MSAIFISHSSADNEWAERISAWLQEQGHESLFLDFDPSNGIPAGRNWKQELHQQLRRCRAVIALCSEPFIGSYWCTNEVAIASNLGKSLFPVCVGTCELPQMLRDDQAIDLTTDPEGGLQRLARGLIEAGLDPKDLFQWNGRRPPYPGLLALQEADAPVFFGRGEAIREGLDGLHNLRRFGGKAVMLVLGASGCGKSSLVRAGIVPRLRRDPEQWLVLDPFRPGADPFAELNHALSRTFRAIGENPPPAQTTAEQLGNQLEALRRAVNRPGATAVIVIDQFEELLSDGDGSSAGTSQAADRFLAFLKDVMQAPAGRLAVLATLRSDFLGSFQMQPQLADLPFADLKLGPMGVEGYAQVIEGPAAVSGLELEPGLSERIVADTRTGDALPLLAFTLRELWERYGGDGDLTLSEYGQLGGLEGSVQRSADGVMNARALDPEETLAVREAFLTMTRINEQGQYARTPSCWEVMPPRAEEVLRRFVEARLLISGKESGTIEVAHEALLRTWPLLKGWLEESKEFLLWRSRTQTAVAERRRSGTLLSGKPLLEAERWRESTAVGSPERKLIDASLKARKRQRRRNSVLGAAGAGVLLSFTGGLWWQLNSLQHMQQRAFEKDHLQLMDSNPLESVVNGVAAMAHHMGSPGINYQLSSTLARAMGRNWALSRPIKSSQGAVYQLVALKNGEVISGGRDGSLRRWKNGRPVGEPMKTGTREVTSLIALKNDELISGGFDGTLRRWKAGQPVGEKIQTGQGGATSLLQLTSGELLSGGADGTLRRWKNGRAIGDGKPIQTGHRSSLISLIELESGDWFSGGADGTLRRWRDGRPVGELIQTGQRGIHSLIALKNGELISGGGDGTLRRWKDGKPVGQPIQTDHWRVMSLVALNNGDLISGGADGTLRRWKDGRPVGGPIQTGQGWVRDLVALKSGELITGGEDGTLRHWKEGGPVGEPVETGQGWVRDLVELRTGELISAGGDGMMQRWRDGQPVGDPIETGQGGVYHLVELKNGELITGGADGTIRRWKDSKPVGESLDTGQGRILSLMVLKNRELISGGADGTLRQWKDGQAIGDPVQTGQGQVSSLIKLNNNELWSGGGDGTLRRWRDGQPLGEPIHTGQGGISSLIQLKNGELISGGNGTLRRWRDGQPLGEPIHAGRGTIWSLIELKNGELIAGGSGEMLLFLSPNRVAEIACEEELFVLLQRPETPADHKARAFCRNLQGS